MNQTNLFSQPSEKGSREWSTFSAVRDTQPGMFRVATPVREQPRYTNVVPIKRHHPQVFTFKGAL
ncbi:MAG: hypothetical protein WC050_00765 [Candidatus Paceibacterota bacterium]